MIYFLDYSVTMEMNFDNFQIIAVCREIVFNGVGNNDMPDNENPDNDITNPYDHSRSE